MSECRDHVHRCYEAQCGRHQCREGQCELCKAIDLYPDRIEHHEKAAEFRRNQTR